MKINAVKIASIVNPLRFIGIGPGSWERKARNAGINLSCESFVVNRSTEMPRLKKEERQKAYEMLKDVGFVWFPNVKSALENLISSDNLIKACHYLMYKTPLDLAYLARKANSYIVDMKEKEFFVPYGRTVNISSISWPPHFDTVGKRSQIIARGYGPVQNILQDSRLTLLNVRDSLFCGKEFILDVNSCNEYLPFIRDKFLPFISKHTLSELDPNEYPFIVLIDGLSGLAHSTSQEIIKASADALRPVYKVDLIPVSSLEELPTYYDKAGSDSRRIKANKDRFLSGKSDN